MNCKFRLLALAVTCGCVACPYSAGASVILPMGNVFSGDTPGGTVPYLTATFEDLVGAVKLTMSTSGLVSGEFVSDWYFNLDEALDPTLLGFASLSGDIATSISQGLNAFQADGDGKYDFVFNFDIAPPADRFGAGETIEYEITYSGVGTFNESSFSFLSLPAGGHGPFITAAHIQGISPSGSAWVSGGGGVGPPPPVVPEPTSVAVWSLLVGLGAFLSARSK